LAERPYGFALLFFFKLPKTTMTTMLRPDITLEFLRNRQKGRLPELLGVELVSLEQGALVGELAIRPALLAPNGFLHAATVVGLADTCCGYACIAHLPEKAQNFTTLELKSNHVSTAREGKIVAKASAVHLGRSTQVWDATVTHGDGKLIAMFRCTQMILY
jgi:1,4-dihydroxy-2-naphthoyl-CoA hydrolase